MKLFTFLVFLLTVANANALEQNGLARVQQVITRGPYRMDIVYLPDGSKCIVTYGAPEARVNLPDTVTMSCNVSPKGP